MKTYRSCVADAYAMRDLLEYLSGRADDYSGNAADYRERARVDEEPEDGYYTQQFTEYEAKAAAFERLLAKLSK